MAVISPGPREMQPQYPDLTPIYRLAGLLKSVGRTADAEALKTAADAEGALKQAHDRRTDAQKLYLDPPRCTTRKQWVHVRAALSRADKAVAWLHSQPLADHQELMVHGVFVLLEAAARGVRTTALARGAAAALGDVGFRCAAIVLAEASLSDPNPGISDLPRQRAAHDAAAALARASRNRGWDDADEQLRIGLVHRAHVLALQAAAA
jgi:hypothetical protein